MIDVNVIPDMIADPSAFEDDAQFRLRAAQAAIAATSVVLPAPP